MTIEELYRSIISQMSPAVGEDEARSAADIIFEDVIGYDKVKRLTAGHRELEGFTVGRVNDIVRRFIAGEPLQYLTGKARFGGLDFKVNSSVLIPRPETAGLVDLIVDRYGSRADLRVLDCGTGSGCIAITLARSLKFPSVDAFDISDAALSVAKENAMDLGVKVSFHKGDILTIDRKTCDKDYDIIVSNPPYILESERKTMENRVYDHEPSIALFVPDDDPIRYYAPIARFAAGALTSTGSLFFEINPLETDALRRCLQQSGFSNVEMLRDYKGNYRYCVASL